MAKSSTQPDPADVFTNTYRFLFHHANDRVKEFKEELQEVKKENRKLHGLQYELRVQIRQLLTLPGGELVQENEELRQEIETLKLQIDGLTFLTEEVFSG